MVTRALTSWLLCVLIGAGALTPRALAAPCCAPGQTRVATEAAPDHACCSHHEESAPASPDRDEPDAPCPGTCTCPKACCATPAPLFSSVPVVMIDFTAEPVGVAPVSPQSTVAHAHALSLLKPPRL